ncbi:MAG: alpha-mannosidase, partial [Armatimonadetes bacterium]|nr:alpha-mannosidase [Armatimonadota bacterium]
LSQALEAAAEAADPVAAAEAVLAPLGPECKAYTIHCAGHAHIDMNWMWNWPETVATTNDTVTTVLRLMREFPSFHFSQSQASVYQILKDYLPELWEEVRQRVAEGRWEVTANHWVEGDKNLASGETLCRHLLYTKRFFEREMGIPYDRVLIDWEPDTFGHCATLPTLLAAAGVRRYYFCRTGPGPFLFWWEGKDGSRVMAFDDHRQWYNGQLTQDLTRHVLEFEAETGLRDFLFIYGVGDHGGGPTRRDLLCALKMAAWPIFPTVRLSTTEAFFAAAEAAAPDLAVVKDEMNFVFEGCFSSQTNIKRANRKSECACVEAEAAALLGEALAGLAYPANKLEEAWRDTLFNQFHDILPGSGVHATYEYAQGLYQRVLAATDMVRTRSLRAVAAQVDTLCMSPCGQTDDARSEAPGVDPGLGFGPGDVPGEGLMSRRGAGAVGCDPVVIFNPSAWVRSEAVAFRLWDRRWPDGEILVTDDTGRQFPAQVTERGNYWSHDYVGVTFPARDVPGLGYRAYTVSRGAPPALGHGCSNDGRGGIENEFFRVEVEGGSGAIVHLIDKATGIDFVPPGERLGWLEYLRETPHGMTAWAYGQFVEQRPLLCGATLTLHHHGPHVASVTAHHRLNDSTMNLTISLAAGVPRVDFDLDLNWLERGGHDRGVPGLRVAFPLAVAGGTARFECANGHVERPTDPRKLTSYTPQYSGGPNSGLVTGVEEVPAQKWLDLTGTHPQVSGPVGATLLNDSRYGFQVDGSTLRMTIVRSSYDPDPLPELGGQRVRFALRPHVGAWTPAEATRHGAAFNAPFGVVGTTLQAGGLPRRKGFAELLTPNAMLSGLKRAEDGRGLIVRLYETDGEAVTARLALEEALVPAGAEAVQTDVLEQPLAESTARWEAGVLSVALPPYGIATVRIG